MFLELRKWWNRYDLIIKTNTFLKYVLWHITATTWLKNVGDLKWVTPSYDKQVLNLWMHVIWLDYTPWISPLSDWPAKTKKTLRYYSSLHIYQQLQRDHLRYLPSSIRTIIVLYVVLFVQRRTAQKDMQWLLETKKDTENANRSIASPSSIVPPSSEFPFSWICSCT